MDDGRDALAEALTAVDLALTQPVHAVRLAASPAASGDPEARAVAGRARGLALLAKGELTAAARVLRATVALADAEHLPQRASEARGSLAYILTLTGDSDGALRTIDEAVPLVDGVPLARLQMQRALVLAEMGRLAESAPVYAEALANARRAGAPALLEADIRNNRSILATQLRDWRGAEADLARAEEIYTALGHVGRTALVQHNRALAAAVRGDVPAALAYYDDAERRYRAAERDAGLLPVEKAETLLSVRLVADARAAAEGAAAAYRRSGNATDLAHARLVLAEAALLDGDAEAARVEATRARRSYLRLGRPGRAALAGHLVLRASAAGAAPDATLLRAGRRTVAELAAAGWAVQELDARLIVARTALALGRVASARRELAAAAAARRAGPADLRAHAWHAAALLRLTEGDRRGAQAALRAGIGVLARFRASLGATELRAQASGHAGELATLGARLALQDGQPAAVLAWAERWRAGALRLRPVRPPDDAALADDLAELRQLVADIAAAAGEGRDTAALLRRQAEVERAVQARSRHAPGGPAAVPGHDGSPACRDRRAGSARPSREEEAPTPARLRAALGSAVLVEYLSLDGRLHAVTVGRRTRLHDLGPATAVAAEVEALRFGLRRAAHGGGSARGAAMVRAAIEAAARRLDALLVRPLAADGVEDAELVVVPTGILHALPWAALPSCVGRPVRVAPSAAIWLRAALQKDDTEGRTVFAAGPDLPAALREVAELADRHPDAVRLTGGAATAAAVTAALDGARLAHIAAHGHLRIDNPMFSALRLADGPLTVYDLERLAAPPRHVVLAACESGLPDVRPGDEQLGLAASLLALGTVSLVAPVLPVPDDESRELMLAFHTHRAAGLDPAAALAAAQRDRPATVVAFLCLGVGDRPGPGAPHDAPTAVRTGGRGAHPPALSAHRRRRADQHGRQR